MRMLELLTSQPFLAEPRAFRHALNIVTRKGIDPSVIPEGLAFKQGRKKDRDDPSTLDKRDGLAVISVHGPIFRHANLMTELCGGATTEQLALDLGSALSDKSVKAIVLDINSPGGEATGIQELAATIRAATKAKPVVAYVGGSGASAAYWIASAASEIVIDPTAMLGSIGVVVGYTDTSAQDEALGLKSIEIVSSQSPRKRLDPMTDEGRDDLQTLVDDMASVFVSSVANYRGVSQSKVLSDFGQGGVLVGKKAVKAGLADRLGSLEGVISELSAGTWRRPSRASQAQPAKADAGQPQPKSSGDKPMSWNPVYKFWKALGQPENFDASGIVTSEEQSDAGDTAVVQKIKTLPEPIRSNLLQGHMNAAASEPLKPLASDNELKAEIAQLRQALEAQKAETAASAETARLASLATSAKTFAATQVTDRRAYPAEATAIEKAYLQAADDDHRSPLADGSRVATLQATFAARPQHNLTSEAITGGSLPKDSAVLNSEHPNRTLEECKKDNEEWLSKRNAAIQATKTQAN